MSLGAFLAGVLLADSEFRHELEADIEPFKGLLLGLFFMAVGMSANLALLVERAARRARRSRSALMLVEVRADVRDCARDRRAERRRAAPRRCALAGRRIRVRAVRPRRRRSAFSTPETAQLLVLVVTISMLLAPLAFVAHERLLDALARARASAPEFDAIDGPGNPGDHRGLRPLRPDRLARAAHVRASRSPRSR